MSLPDFATNWLYNVLGSRTTFSGLTGVNAIKNSWINWKQGWKLQLLLKEMRKGNDKNDGNRS